MLRTKIAVIWVLVRISSQLQISVESAQSCNAKQNEPFFVASLEDNSIPERIGEGTGDLGCCLILEDVEVALF